MNFLESLKSVHRILRDSPILPAPPKRRRIPPLVVHLDIQDQDQPQDCLCEKCLHVRQEKGLADQPFHVTQHMRSLAADVILRVESFRHIDLSKVLIAVTHARNRRTAGLQAKVTPMRFHQGEQRTVRRGKEYQVQKYLVSGKEMLYIVSFCIPRFLDLPFEEKLITLFHELYHISPHFDGDLRRHPGRYMFHTPNQKCYDKRMAEWVTEYLSNHPPESLLDPMRLSFDSLHRKYGGVVGIHIPIPKLIPVDAIKLH